MRRRFCTLAALALLVPSLGAQAAVCTPLDTNAAWARINREWKEKPGERWTDGALRSRLLAMVEEDQEARKDFGARVADTAYVRTLIAADSARAVEVAGIVDRVGLPTRAMVGAAGADAFMLIVQHNWPLQERVLALAAAAPPGQLPPHALAMLEDRVLVHRGAEQRFGTQFNIGPDGLFRFAATADLAGLAARRERAGLPPLDQYACMMEEAGMRIDRASLPR